MYLWHEIHKCNDLFHYFGLIYNVLNLRTKSFLDVSEFLGSKEGLTN